MKKKEGHPKKHRSSFRRALNRIAEFVRLRFVDGRSTGEIMGTLRSETDRRTMAAVASLDLPQKDFEDLIAGEQPDLRSDLMALRQNAWRILRGYL
ncbi:MAG TPA: hypothetical protein VL688_05615 [Verrucomicrobiae bacterium]|jgi:hypothetical protein|nr:hypothetical protein [Verrucomicrobiae bacterium]